MRRVMLARAQGNSLMWINSNAKELSVSLRPLEQAALNRFNSVIDPHAAINREICHAHARAGLRVGGVGKEAVPPRGNREPIERVRARLEALVRANAAPRCGARSKRTGKPCRGAAMPNGRCKVHGGKSTGPRTPEGLERSRRANWKHGYFSREAKSERSRVRAAILTLRDLCDSDLRPPRSRD
jgi:hypothetical protein